MPRHASTLLATLAATIALSPALGAAPSMGEWSTPQRLDSLPGTAGDLLTGAVEGCVALSSDMRTLYFTTNRLGDFDIYSATRDDRESGFANVRRLPAPINVPGSNESCPSVGPGNRLFFTSTRDGHAWGDLYVARKVGFGWTEPENLGPNINTEMMEEVATIYEDHAGREVMLFARRPQGVVYPFAGPGTIYQSINGGPATVVPGLPNEGDGNRPWVSRDGKTLLIDSTRGGGSNDLWRITRSGLSSPWSSAELLPINSDALELRPFMSHDGTFLMFSSNRPGSKSPAPDIWFSTREKRRGN